MYRSPACVSGPFGPHTAGTDIQTPVISLVGVPPIEKLNRSVSIPSRGGDFDTGGLDERLREENSEKVAGTRIMKRIETTK